MVPREVSVGLAVTQVLDVSSELQLMVWANERQRARTLGTCFQWCLHIVVRAFVAPMCMHIGLLFSMYVCMYVCTYVCTAKRSSSLGRSSSLSYDVLASLRSCHTSWRRQD